MTTKTTLTTASKLIEFETFKLRFSLKFVSIVPCARSRVLQFKLDSSVNVCLPFYLPLNHFGLQSMVQLHHFSAQFEIATLCHTVCVWWTMRFHLSVMFLRRSLHGALVRLKVFFCLFARSKCIDCYRNHVSPFAMFMSTNDRAIWKTKQHSSNKNHLIFSHFHYNKPSKI